MGTQVQKCQRGHELETLQELQADTYRGALGAVEEEYQKGLVGRQEGSGSALRAMASFYYVPNRIGATNVLGRGHFDEKGQSRGLREQAPVQVRNGGVCLWVEQRNGDK